MLGLPPRKLASNVLVAVATMATTALAAPGTARADVSCGSFTCSDSTIGCCDNINCGCCQPGADACDENGCCVDSSGSSGGGGSGGSGGSGGGGTVSCDGYSGEFLCDAGSTIGCCENPSCGCCLDGSDGCDENGCCVDYDGSSSSAGGGGGGTTCPDSHPYLCNDGYCYATSDCGGATCPDYAPVLCNDGLCYENESCGGGGCPDHAPYLCSDQLCYPTENCDACPPSYPYDCGDGYCGTSEEACINGDTTPGGGASPGGGEGTSPIGGGSGVTPGGGGEGCTDAGAYEGCESVQSCFDGTDGYYVTDDGTRFYCYGDCYTAANDTLAYCEDQAGCSAPVGPARGGIAGLAAFAVLGLSAVVRKLRSRSEA